jgi:8-oxo-dGTP pyrophosphatase MutT (NUDIX family)
MFGGKHDKHYVSVKLALYSSDLQSVLIMRYPSRGANGMPGGHIDAKEHPDFALRRELMEELSLAVDNVKRVDFFLHKGIAGRIILAYTAIAPADIVITPTDPKFEYGEWLTKDEFEKVDMSPEYKRFTLENWPKI